MRLDLAIAAPRRGSPVIHVGCVPGRRLVSHGAQRIHNMFQLPARKQLYEGVVT